MSPSNASLDVDVVITIPGRPDSLMYEIRRLMADGAERTLDQIRTALEDRGKEPKNVDKLLFLLRKEGFLRISQRNGRNFTYVYAGTLERPVTRVGSRSRLCVVGADAVGADGRLPLQDRPFARPDDEDERLWAKRIDGQAEELFIRYLEFNLDRLGDATLKAMAEMWLASRRLTRLLDGRAQP